MKKRTQFIIGIIAISALIAGSAFAANTETCAAGKDKASYKEKHEAIMRQLNLTAEQDKLLKDAKAANRTEMEALMKSLKDAHQELQSALAKPGVTKEELAPITTKIKDLQSQMVDLRINETLKVKNILSPDQFQKLQSAKEGWHKGGHKKGFEKRE